MAIERAREYEFRERMMEDYAIRFYSLATHILLNKGLPHVSSLRGSYLEPVVETGQGGAIRTVGYSHDIPWLVFARAAEENHEVSTIVLASITQSREQFEKYPQQIDRQALDGKSTEMYHSFDLYIVDGEASVKDVLNGKKAAFKFSVDHGTTDRGRISVHGKNVFSGGRFDQGVTGETVGEFGDIVDLVKQLSASPESFKEIKVPRKSVLLQSE